MSNLGSAYNNTGQYRQAIDFFEQVLEIRREIGDRRGEASSLNDLGIAHRSQGNYEQALTYFEYSLALRRGIGDRFGETQALSNIGSLYRLLGDYQTALEFFNQSLAFSQEIGDRRGEATSLASLGNIYLSLEDYAQALSLHEQALAISREIGDRESEMNTLIDIGNAYALLGEDQQAVDIFEQSLAISREIGIESIEGENLHKLGNLYYAEEQLEQAEYYLLLSIETLSNLRPNIVNPENTPTFELQADNYRKLQEILIAQDRITEALGFSEQGRTYDALSFLLSYEFDNESESLSKSYEARLTGERIQRIARQQNATIINYSIAASGDIFVWVVQPSGDIDFRRVNLGIDSPLAEMVEATRSSASSEIDRGEAETALASLIRGTRESIGVRDLGNPNRESVVINENEQREDLQALHKILIAPIEDLLPDNPDDLIIFVPQDSLFLVPFAALQDESGQYLIENHTILTVSRLEVLETIDESVGLASGEAALVIGNPQMPMVNFQEGESPQELDELPGAEDEAKKVAELLNTAPLIGAIATETDISQRILDAEIIHLATHGLLDVVDLEGLPIPGAIALTPGDEHDGFLTAVEILNMDLRADLVVLSACNTGLGRQVGGSVIGLPFALSLAGVSNVVVSLWSVPDAPTALLMEEFYQHLKDQVANNPNQDPNEARALRHAMLEILDTEVYQNPRNWAAFTLIKS